MADRPPVASRVAAAGLIAPGKPVTVLLSGGRDSVCLLDVAVLVAGEGMVEVYAANNQLLAAALDGADGWEWTADL